MAPKQPVHLPPPAPSTSSSDDDDETEGSISTTSSDEQQPPKQISQSQDPKSSEPDPDSESDADSDDTQNAPSASVPKPVSKSPKPKSPTSKSNKLKRPATERSDKVSKNKKKKISNGDDVENKASKKGKLVNGNDEDGGDTEEKKSIIKWSEGDEIVLLNGMIDFKANNGADPNAKTDAFYDFVSDLISVGLTRNQLFEKIRRLKKKFQVNAGKRQNGEDVVFSKPGEQKLFDLSQKIWGEGNDSKVKISRKKKEKKDGNVVRKELVFVEEGAVDTVMENNEEEAQDFWSLYPLLCESLESEASSHSTMVPMNSKEFVKKVISGLGEASARLLEDKWKVLHVKEYQLYAQKAQMISDQAQSVSFAIKRLYRSMS